MDLPGAFSFNDTVAFLGTVDVREARFNDAGFVNVEGIEASGATVFVCPQMGGEQDEVPPFPILEDRCREEDQYQDPTVSIQGRTWVQSRGTLDPSPVRGALTMVWEGEGEMGFASTLPGEGFAAGVEGEGAFAFTPTRASSEIHVEEAGQASWYNGTDWVFYFEDSSTLGVEAGGMHANVTSPVGFEVSPAPRDAFRSANEPRILLDVQDAMLGPDEREPVSNMTRIFSEYGRIPQLSNGAVLGHLEGSVGDRAMNAEGVSLVRVDPGSFRVEAGDLEGEASVVFVRSEGGFASGTGDPVSVPWLLVGALWLGAGVALWLRDGHDPPSWHRFLGVGLGVVAFLAWDLAFHRLVGESGVALAFGPARLGEVVAVLGFEVAALGLAWLLVFVPGRVVVERAFGAWWARPAWGVVGIVALSVFPAAVLAFGFLVARL